MSPYFLGAIVPIVVVAAVLTGVAARRRRWGLAAWCLALVGWAMSLALAGSPATRELGNRVLMIGWFAPAGFLHAVLEDLGMSRKGAWAAYAWAAALFVLGLHPDDLFLRDGGTTPGPWFGPMFVSSAIFSAIPCALLMQRAGITLAPSQPTERARYLLAAGVLSVLGGGTNIITTLLATTHPAGLYLMLAALALLSWVVQADRLPRFRRFVEASLGYTAAAAVISALFSAALLALVPPDGGWFLLFLLVLVSQPLLGWLRGVLAARFFPGHADVGQLHQSLAEAEARADHAQRLAEVGTLASAVAHEVRNPIGVIQACVAMLRRAGSPAPLLDEIDTQLDRSARFATELLSYARPEPMSLREVELHTLFEVAAGEVRAALGPIAVDVDGAGTVEADAGQVQRLFAILLENAVLVGATRLDVTVRGGDVRVTDDGPGVPAEIVDRLFTPFVSGRGRDGPRPGTGLGLAIARGIAERHHGALRYVGNHPGATFELRLPLRQRTA